MPKPNPSPKPLHVSLRIGGLSILIGSAATKSAEIAMINPSPEHLLPSDKLAADRHLPLLVMRKENIWKDVEGEARPFTLTGAIKPEWLDGAQNFGGFIGWSVQGAVLKLDDMMSDSAVPETGLRLVRSELAPDQQDCKSKKDWKSLRWVANLNEILPGLALAPEWRECPHVGARLPIGKGTLTASPPIVGQPGNLKIKFERDETSRVFTDAFLYEIDLQRPMVVVDGPNNRWRVILKGKPGKPIPLWLFSLDDTFDADSKESLTAHFHLYSLLPWRFKVPAFDFCEASETQGGCINCQYHA